MRRFTYLAVPWGLAASLMLLVAVPAAGQDLGKLSEDPGQWVLPGKDYALTRYSTLDQINKSNVGNLHVAWAFATGTDNGLEGAPLVVGNTMYFVTSFPNKVYALEAATGKTISRMSSTCVTWLRKPRLSAW